VSGEAEVSGQEEVAVTPDEPLPLVCASCGRQIPDGEMVCRFCDDTLPDPATGYRELRGEVRGVRGWVVLSFVLGIVVAPFAIYRITRALARFRHVAQDDPVSYRELVVLRRMAVGLVIVWSILLAGWAGLEFRGSTEPPEALVLDAALARMVRECACPDTTIYLSPGTPAAFDRAVLRRLSKGRHLVVEEIIAGINNRNYTRYETVVILFPPRFVSKNLAEVSGQLRNGATGSFGATYTVRRDGKGVWKAISRQTWWSS
jgi:hypothetical protein